VKALPSLEGPGRSRRHAGSRLVWLTIGCTSLAAACGLDLAGEEFTDDDAGVGSSSSGSGGGTGSGTMGDSGRADLDDGGGGFGGSGNGPPGSSGGPTPSSDAAPGTCDFNGTWGSLLTIDVNWMPAGLNLQAFILAPGVGTIRQWIKGTRVQQGNQLEDTTVVCGIDLPDFQGTQVAGSQTYGVVFPDSLFDGMGLPSFQVQETVTSPGPGATFTASASAALLGLTMANPTTDPWPATITTATDPDHDGTPGVTVNAAVGVVGAGDAGLYSDIPVGVPAPFQPVAVANQLQVVVRQVTAVTGTVADCDHVAGTVSIPEVAGVYAINSHVIGCELVDGGACSDAQASFVDNTQPVFTPSGKTTFASARMPAGATCATVRQMLK
jgi:hypothetical protein